MLSRTLRRLVVPILVASAGLGADWPSFRGPNGSGLAEGPAPIEFGPGKSELWRLPLGPGHSSPAIVGDLIYLTTADREKQRVELLAIDRREGKIRWRRALPVDEFEKGHPSFHPASSTAAADRDVVVAYFGSYGLVAYDPAGEKLWELRLPVPKSYGGNAISPLIAGGRVILYRGNRVDHFLLALDKLTGKELWKTELEERYGPDMACTAMPIVAGDRVIVHGMRAVQAFELATGKIAWEAKCSTTGTSTPVLAGDEVVVATWNQTGEASLTPEFPPWDELAAKHDRDKDGVISKEEFPKLWFFHRSEGAEAPENGYPLSFRRADGDRDGRLEAAEWKKLYTERKKQLARYVPHGLLAIPLRSAGAVEEKDLRTLIRSGIPEVPSPLVHGGRVHFVKNGGILTVVDLKSGKRLARLRTKGRGTHYASPVIAGGKLYSTAGDGRISVLDVSGETPAIIATNDLEERTYATPAVVDGVIYVRTHAALWAFGSRD